MLAWKIFLTMASCASASASQCQCAQVPVLPECQFQCQCEDTYTRIAIKACGKVQEYTSREIQIAVRLLLPGELAKHVVNAGKDLQGACNHRSSQGSWAHFWAAEICSGASTSNMAAPPGYVAKEDSGACQCTGSGWGLESCGDLCCAASPYTDPNPKGQYYYKKNGNTKADFCYEKAAPAKAARMYKEGDDSVKVAAGGAPWGVNMVVMGLVFLGTSFLLITRVAYIYKKDLATPCQEARTEPESELGLLSTMPE